MSAFSLSRERCSPEKPCSRKSRDHGAVDHFERRFAFPGSAPDLVFEADTCSVLSSASSRGESMTRSHARSSLQYCGCGEDKRLNRIAPCRYARNIKEDLEDIGSKFDAAPDGVPLGNQVLELCTHPPWDLGASYRLSLSVAHARKQEDVSWSCAGAFG